MQNLNLDSPFYRTSEIMQLLGVGKTKACELMREWRAELAAMGKYGGSRGQISKGYVNEKLYNYKAERSKSP